MSQSAPNLDEIRSQITETDHKLLELLATRRQLSEKVADSKIASGKPVRDVEREEALLIALVKNGRELGLDAHFVTKIFHTIIEDSVLNQQAKLQKLANPDTDQPLNRVAFLGAKGSYSHLATQKYFSRRPGELMEVSCSSFPAIIEAVETNIADYAVLPIENTSSGSINEVFDVLQHTSLSIIGELTHPIEHSMLVALDTKVENIRHIYTHPQVFSQCSHYLANLSDIKLNPVASSSDAMLKVSELQDPTAAALGSPEGGKLYGLKLIESNLANQKENHSRFIVVARKPIQVPEQLPCKTTLIMSTSQRPGSLVEALLVLKNHGINMTKLESRPITGNPWEEMFYLDIDANTNHENTQLALKELVNLTRFIKVLGCYPSEDILATELPTSAIIHSSASSLIENDANLSSRETQQLDTIIKIKNVSIGDKHFVSIVESRESNSEKLTQQLSELKNSGAEIVWLSQADLAVAASVKSITDRLKLPLALTVKDSSHVTKAAKIADALVIEAENMNKSELLKEVGKTHKPVVLQREPLSSLNEWLAASETILKEGNQQVILCEHGVRTLDSSSRNILDLSAIPVIKQKTHLPAIIAPAASASDEESLNSLVAAAKTLKASGAILPLGESKDCETLQLSISQLTQAIAALH